MTNTFDRFNSWKGLIYSDVLKQLAETLKNPQTPCGSLPFPINWHIYASNTCPYNCNFCIMKDEKKRKGMLSPAILQKAINDAARVGVKLIHFSGGGEPLTNPYLSEAIEYAQMRGIRVALSTNGFLLDKLKSQVDHLRVSFNAGDKETYAKIHGVDSFEKVIENIKEAVRLKKGKHIGMGFVLTHENYTTVRNFVALAEECGVEFVHIRPAYLPGKNKEVMDAVKEVAKMNLRSDKVKIFAVSEKFAGFWDENKHLCRATPIHACLAATGEFLICQDRLDLRFGNYYNQSFEEIWFSKEHYDALGRAQDCNLRCVECTLNEIISRVFINDEIAKELI